ncbi:MAG: response regulator [Planctomycetota bacterium]
MVVLEKRILVVDDEKIVRDSCQRALTEAGYAVRTVAGGHDALRACRAEPFDVMLTDLRMPDMDGLEVIRAMAEEFPEVRIVVITGYPSQQSAEQARKLGIFDYLEKPLSPTRLSEATAAVLAQPPRATASVFSTETPRSSTAAPAKARSPQREEGRSEAVAPTPARRAVHNRARQAVLIAMGFLAGVLVAYVIAPVHALAYLAVGSAIASGTVLGLFSDALFAKSGGSTLEGVGAGEQQRGTRAFLRTLVDGIPDVALVIDRNHRIVLANRAAREMARQKGSGTGSMTCYQLLHHSNAACPELGKKCTLEQVVETKRPGTVRHTHRDADGNEVLVEITASPVFDESGEVVEIIEACRNVEQPTASEGNDVADRDGGVEPNFNSVIERTERELLENALKATGGNKTTAAAALGLKASTFRDKLAKYGLS